MNEYLYVLRIHDRGQCKFGRTDNFEKRLQQYENTHGHDNVSILLLYPVFDSVTFEKKILNLLYNDSRVTLIKGNEFFDIADFHIIQQYIEKIIYKGHKLHWKKINKNINRESTISKEGNEKYTNSSIANHSVEQLVQSEPFRKMKLKQMWIDNPQDLQNKLQGDDGTLCSDIQLFDNNSCNHNVNNKISISLAFSLLKNDKIINTCSKCKSSDVIMHRRKRDTKHGKKNNPHTYCINCC